MPRCSNCGRLNPDVATFCQDCGTRLESRAGGEADAMGSGPAGVPGAAQSQESASGSGPEAAEQASSGGGHALCSACGTSNPPGMIFCRQCGGRLPKDGQATPQPSIACPSCGRSTPSGFNFCQHCGYRLADSDMPAPASPPTPPSGMPVSTASEPLPTTPTNRPRPTGRSRTPSMGVGPVAPVPSVVSPVAPRPFGSEGTPVMPAAPVLTSSGYTGGAQATPMSIPNAVAGTIAQDRSPSGGLPTGSPTEAPPFKLVSVNRDGSDGVTFPVVGERLDIGRRTGTLLFEDDGYLSDRHVRLERRNGDYYLVDLDSLNGVYVRIREKEELRDGIRALVGMEVLRFELISEQERDPAPAVEHGVLVFGTPPKLPWARLRQVTTAGICRDVFHLYRAEVVVGRESGDIVFSDDDFMSRMHAAIRNEGGKAWLVDLNSSNGTYIQVYKERLLQPGDFIRLGDQLLRYEAV